MSRRNRNNLTWGLILVLFGGILLLNNYVPVLWPLGITTLGLCFLLAAGLNRVGGLAIPGGILLVNGLLLFYQAVTHNWSSWYYLWPLSTAGLGLGMVIGNLLGMGGKKTRRTGWLWLLSGVVLSAGSWLVLSTNPGSLSWPWIITGLGIQFLVVSLLSRVSGLAIPGTIVTVTGGLLTWQNATGNWASWSFVWPLVLLSVGLGFVVAYFFGLRSRALAIVGLYFIFISAVFFFIFAAFFARELPLVQFWPVVLILLGGGLLLQGRKKRLSTAQ